MSEPEKRALGRPRGGRRETDPIFDLRSLGDSFVTVAMLAEYWRFYDKTIIGWIKRGRLPAMQCGRDYRVRASDALLLEAELYKRPQ